MNVGDKVWIANKDDRTVSVGRGRVSALGGAGMFHLKPIPVDYVRVDLETVLVNTSLLVPVDIADQNTLDDALGSAVLWLRNLTFKID